MRLPAMRLRLPAMRQPLHISAARAPSPAMLTTTGWDGPGFFVSGGVDLSYWDLHGLLLIPTAFLLTAGYPTLLREESDPLRRQAAFTYLGFILSIAVAQAFVWDSVGATIGIWEFNPDKTTGLGASTLLPLEEILWLFHHVIKAALWQLKVAEVPTVAAARSPAPMPDSARAAGNTLLAASFVAGVGALVGDIDEAKCLGLIAAFFAPVLAIVWNLGSRYISSHWRLFVGGWVVPGWWTVFIDCVGQQQGVWTFPPRYLTGIATLDGWLKLDIAAVYLVSTLAVTATGAIILAAADEYAALREARVAAPAGPVPASLAETVAPQAGAWVSEAGLSAREPTLWDLGLFIFDNAAPGAAQPMERLRADAAQRWERLAAPADELRR